MQATELRCFYYCPNSTELLAIGGAFGQIQNVTLLINKLQYMWNSELYQAYYIRLGISIEVPQKA